MKFCIWCGKELPEQAVFCSGCGSKLDGANQSFIVNTNDVNEKVTNKFTIAKATVQKSGYFSYFKATLARPSSAIDSETSKNGWIHLIVLTLATTFGLYMIMRSRINLLFSQFGSGSMSDYNDTLIRNTRDEILPRLTLVSFVASFVIYFGLIAIAFLSLKIMTKNTQTFNQTLSQYGGLLTPNIILVTLVGLLSFMSTISADEVLLGFSTIIFSFSLLLCLASYNFFLYKKATKKGLDKLYVLLVSNLLLVVIMGMIAYTQIALIIEVIIRL